jgi:xylulokinase
MENLFLGIDSSTQSCKIICIDSDEGTIVFQDSVNYDRDLPEFGTKDGVIPSREPGVSEADPRMWIRALELLFEQLKRNNFPLNLIKAITVSGQQHGLVCMDSQGNLTRKTSKLWNDVSTEEECEILTEAVGGKQAMIKEIGNSQRPGYTASKILNFYHHEPEAAAKTKIFFLVHNYLNWFLTGGIALMEPGDVSGMALSFPGSHQWSEKVCSAIAPDLATKLPPIRKSDLSIGPITENLVQRYGFSPTCRIDAGSGDNMYGAIGTGNVHSGIVTISLGTSGTAYTILDEPYVDPLGEIALFCDSTGKFMPLLCVSNMANGYNDLLRIHKLDYDKFDQLLKMTSPGNGGKFIFPWFVGERTPDLPKAKPIFWGFGLKDFQLQIMCRAVLEGHILNLFDGYRRMPVNSQEIRLTGGLSNSDSWCQTIADIFDCETVPVKGEGAALGAAVHAAWVYFKETSNQDRLSELVSQFVILDEGRRKKPVNAEAYRTLKKVYSEVSRRLRQGGGGLDPFSQVL